MQQQPQPLLLEPSVKTAQFQSVKKAIGLQGCGDT